MLKIALAALALTLAAAGAARAELHSYTFTGYAKGVDTVGLFGTAGASYDAPITISAAEKGSLDDYNTPEGVIFSVSFLGREFSEVEDIGYIDFNARPIVSVDSLDDDSVLSLVIQDLTSVNAGFWTTRANQRDSGEGGYDTFNLYRTSAAPEPSTWALMLAGVGLAGAALRARRRTTLVA